MKITKYLVLATAALLTGCVYHPPFEQGNILTPAKMNAIHNGMTSAEVTATLGSPVLKNAYHDNRMSYVYTNQPSRSRIAITRFIVDFQNDHVVDIKRN